MFCPNCRAENEPDAKFCANCGTILVPAGHQPPVAPPPPPPVSQSTPYQQTPAYQTPVATGGQNSMLKNIGVGCLIAVVIVLFVGLSCTRACFSPRRTHIIRRY